MLPPVFFREAIFVAFRYVFYLNFDRQGGWAEREVPTKAGGDESSTEEKEGATGEEIIKP